MDKRLGIFQVASGPNRVYSSDMSPHVTSLYVSFTYEMTRYILISLRPHAFHS
jgi:hypothetical protein